MLLSKDYVLRGWKFLPYAVCNVNTGETIFIPKDEFDFLVSCDGQNDNLDSPFLDKYLEKKIIEENNNKLAQYQKYKIFESRFIQGAHWALTNRCNFKCKHCFLSAPHASSMDLSFDSCKQIIDELVRNGIFQISLTGGEPFHHKSILDILRYIKKCKIVLTDIYTNGSLLNEPLLQEIKNLEFNPVFHISFDGIGTHNWMRGIPNAESLTIRAIRLLKKYDYKVSISCCICKINLPNMIDTIEFLNQEQVDSINWGIINNIGEWENYSAAESITIAEILSYLLIIIPVLVSKNYSIDFDFAGFLMIKEGGKSYSIPMERDLLNDDIFPSFICCSTRRKILYINPVGTLLGCEAFTNSEFCDEFPNLLNTPLEEILSSDNFFVNFIDQRLKQLISNNELCKDCLYLKICHGGCRGNAYIQGEYWGVDSNACTFFKGGYFEQIEELMQKLHIKKV